MGSTTVLLTVILLYAAASSPTVQSFTCTTTTTPTCTALVGYVPRNATTLAQIASLFAIPNYPSLLGANNLPISTKPTEKLPANNTVTIPFTCACGNGSTGVPKSPPVYTVVPGDGLSHIAEQVFGGLVRYQEIADFNGVKDVNLIEVGQKLKIPLPCSCDEVEGERVVHYGHVVEAGSSVEAIAKRFGTTEATLMRLNGLKAAGDLLAAVAIDVPLKACTSKVSSQSLDYPLLLSNGTYTLTAGGCVKCNCDSSNNYTLQCEPSSSTNTTAKCHSLECKGTGGSLLLGKTSNTSSCNSSTCAYAGYTIQSIITELASESTCPVSNNNNGVQKFGLQVRSWSFFLIASHFVLFGLHFI